MTFVYRCDLEHEFEVQQRITDAPIERCQFTPPPTRALCGKPCKRVIQPVGFALKGGGWAKDGYK